MSGRFGGGPGHKDFSFGKVRKGYFSGRGAGSVPNLEYLGGFRYAGRKITFDGRASQWCFMSVGFLSMWLRSDFEGKIYFKWGRIVTSGFPGMLI